jgi:hypothetical protein
MTNNSIDTYTINIDSGLYNINYPTVNLTSGYNIATYDIATSGGIQGTGTWAQPVLNATSQGKISITGEQADIDINGKSLKTWMEKVEQKLAILEPNPKLEDDWAELKELGDKYRALEKDIHEKMKTWEILKQPE